MPIAVFYRQGLDFPGEAPCAACGAPGPTARGRGLAGYSSLPHRKIVDPLAINDAQ